MRNKQIEKIIKTEIDSEVPDVMNKILKNCKGEKIIMKKDEKRNSLFDFKHVLAYTFTFILVVFLGVVSFNKYSEIYVVNSIIELDVNPSIELKINSKEKIIEANALNNDGKKILNNMDLKNSDLNLAVNAIIGSMYKNGYISEIKNSILVSVQNEDKIESEKLQKKLTNEINNVLNTYSLTPSVITQEYKSNSTITKKAQEYGLSNGKTEYIENILKEGLTDKKGNKYTFEELADLNINELNAILNSKNKTVSKTTTSGSVSTKGYIGNEKAKTIALANAGVSDSSITNFEIELDYENGVIVYEISFDSSSREYDYEINAISGAIVNKEVEQDDDYIAPNKNTSQSTKKSNSNTGNSSNKTSSSSNNSKNYISRSKAKTIALSDAGLSEGKIRDLDIELDRENGKMVYEVNFESGNKEYDYNIDATSGKIINKNVELDD